jgi:diadenosine tetraphosphate (Ap4A) HIT family hydrolase
VYRGRHWSVSPVEGREVPGWYRVILRRHGESIASLSATEAVSLGPLLARLGNVLLELLAPERIYVYGYGENHAHLHFLVCPRGPEVPGDQRGAKLYSYGKTMVDVEAAETVAAEVKKRLRGRAGPVPESARS